MSSNGVVLNREIKHIQQSKSNDCGIACLKMVLSYVLKTRNEVLLEQDLMVVLKELEVVDKSLWTIDIAHVLALHNVKHSMNTITIGVLDIYSTNSFYNNSRDNFESDQERINKKFRQAVQLGINVAQRSVTLDDIKAELKLNACVILLVNAIKLKGVNLNFNYKNEDDLKEILSHNRNIIDRMLTRAVNILKPTAYLGHFILLVGFDSQNGVFFYLNPSSSKNLSFTSENDLESARKSFGTDEDIIFVHL